MEFCPNCEIRLKKNDSGLLHCPKCQYLKEKTDTGKTRSATGIGFTIDHDGSMESMDRKEKGKKCSQEARPFREILRERGAETEAEITSKLLAYLAKDWFSCHVCRKQFEEDQNIWKHMEEEEWCHEECREFFDEEKEQTVSHPYDESSMDREAWRQQYLDTRLRDRSSGLKLQVPTLKAESKI